MNDTEKFKVMDGIYARLPRLNCQRRCQECCGPITMNRLEFQRLVAIDPTLKHKRARLFTEGGAALGSGTRLIVDHYGNCPFLKNGACSVYGIRPLICRLWGMTHGMPCPFGCQPERVLTEKEAYEIMHEVMRLNY